MVVPDARRLVRGDCARAGLGKRRSGRSSRGGWDTWCTRERWRPGHGGWRWRPPVTTRRRARPARVTPTTPPARQADTVATAETVETESRLERLVQMGVMAVLAATPMRPQPWTLPAPPLPTPPVEEAAAVARVGLVPPARRTALTAPVGLAGAEPQPSPQARVTEACPSRHQQAVGAAAGDTGAPTLAMAARALPRQPQRRAQTHTGLVHTAALTEVAEATSSRVPRATPRAAPAARHRARRLRQR
jgi:hypothetical protein